MAAALAGPQVRPEGLMAQSAVELLHALPSGSLGPEGPPGALRGGHMTASTCHCNMCMHDIWPCMCMHVMYMSTCMQNYITGSHDLYLL